MLNYQRVSRNADLRSPRVLTVDDPLDDPPSNSHRPGSPARPARTNSQWMSRAPKGAERATDPHTDGLKSLKSSVFGLNMIKPLQIVIQPSEISVISAM